MSRSSSVPNAKTYSKDSDLPRITRNSWLTKGAKNNENNDYLRNKRSIARRYIIIKKDINNSTNNIANNPNIKSNSKNNSIYEQIYAIDNNYKEMKNMLKNKINKIEQNQKRINNILKYSIAQGGFRNNLNNYRDKNIPEKEYLLNILKKFPKNIENKLNKIYLNELEENRNQEQFLNILKDKMNMEFQQKRRRDYLKYKRQLNDLMNLKNKEEIEKMFLYHKIEKQRIVNKIKEMKYKNQIYRYQAFNNYNFPYYQLMQENLKNLKNNNQNSIGLSMDELIKILLFTQIIKNSVVNDNNQNMINNNLLNPLMNENPNFPLNNFYGPFNRGFKRRSRMRENNFDNDYYLNKNKYNSYNNNYDYKHKDDKKIKTFDKTIEFKYLKSKKKHKKSKKVEQKKSNISLNKEKNDIESKLNKEEPKNEEKNEKNIDNNKTENKEDNVNKLNLEESDSDADSEVESNNIDDNDDEEDDGEGEGEGEVDDDVDEE